MAITVGAEPRKAANLKEGNGRRGSCRALAERQQPMAADSASANPKSFAKKEKRRRQVPLGMHDAETEYLASMFLVRTERERPVFVRRQEQTSR
jgi:hypothetical protein